MPERETTPLHPVRRRHRRALALYASQLLLASATGWGAGRVVHEERSLYRNILVTKQGSELCLRFSVRREQRNQSCMNTRYPRRMVFTYTRMMMATLLLVPEPRTVLVVGLGGGTLPMALRELYPEATIDAVEIDPAVARIAAEYFGFKADERLQVHLQDARVFTKRALRKPRRYDLILLDAFNGDYIPEHLMTVEYLEESRALLTPRGVLAANTFAISRLYDHESVTYEQAFGHISVLKVPESANRIILGTAGAPFPSRSVLAARAAALEPRLKAYEVPLKRYPKFFSSERDWDPGARPLTDDYAPANLLQGR